VSVYEPSPMKLRHRSRAELAVLDELLLQRFQGRVARGLALKLSWRQGASEISDRHSNRIEGSRMTGIYLRRGNHWRKAQRRLPERRDPPEPTLRRERGPGTLASLLVKRRKPFWRK
jgi:hypothetical protein